MKKQVVAVCQAAYGRLRAINNIRKTLTEEATKILVHAFVTSRLDNANSLLSGIPASALTKLQRIQNAAARTVLRIRKRDHITPALKVLHWLPVKQRIQFKVLTLTWKALHNEAPQYITDLLIPLSHTRTLRSSKHLLLCVPRTNLKTCGDRSFSVVAPRAWNGLPLEMRQLENRDMFKLELKTFLFHCAFES